MPSGTYSITATTCSDYSFTLPSALNNQTNVTLRFIMTSNTNVNNTTVLSTGTSGLDNITIMASPLPIKIKSFEISKLKESKTLLNLITASETNNDYFTIERSGDGVAYEAIGQIKGAGNSSKEISYEFVDEKPLSGINYYRIKQTDFDGQYSYSDIRSVRFKGIEQCECHAAYYRRDRSISLQTWRLTP
ncbi:MAG: hypothetical protein IPP49_12800 [Saprospiraceae bacterium]|nr:hypothetical protein [Saprospiraceae bacterium]